MSNPEQGRRDDSQAAGNEWSVLEEYGREHVMGDEAVVRPTEDEMYEAVFEDFASKRDKEFVEQMRLPKNWRAERGKEIVYSMGDYHHDSKDILKTKAQNARTQEIIERELNEQLTTVDQLEDAANIEDPRIEKRTMDYEDDKVVIYDLKGLPYSILSTAIDYRKQGFKDGTTELNPNTVNGNLGALTMLEVLKDPAVWNTPEYEMQKQEGWGKWYGDPKARGNTISASYVRSDKPNMHRVKDDGFAQVTGTYKNLCYGFSHVEGDSIIRITLGDGRTTNDIGHEDTQINPGSLDVLNRLENNNTTYNEVVLRRYSETGKPRRPDFIITEDGQIPPLFLKHASYFGIPIINIETKYYKKK